MACGSYDVAFRVEAHAIDATVHATRILAPGKQRVVRSETAVLLDRIRAQLTRDSAGRATLCDIKRFLILRYQDAVGLGGIEGDPRDGVAAIRLRIGTQARTVVEF